MDENNKDTVIKNDNSNIETNDQTIEKTETNIEEIKKDAELNLADNITSKPDHQPVVQSASNTDTKPNIEPAPKIDTNTAPQIIKEEQPVQKQENVNNSNTTANQPQKDKKGFSIAALVLGIVAIVLSFLWYISIPCGILAIVFGTIGIKSSKRGMSISGIVTGIIGMIISIFIILMLVIFGFALGITESIKDIIDDNDYSDSYDYDYDYDSFYNF